MPDISRITLPSGTTYDIKDTVAREAISGGVTFIVSTDAANTPAGVQWVKDSTTITGTLAAGSAQPGAFYLVPISSEDDKNIYAEYIAVNGSPKTWERLGDTTITGLNTTTANVLGASATFSASGTTVGANGTASAITGYDDVDTDTFVKSVTAETNKKMDVVSITGVSGSTTASKATAGTAINVNNGNTSSSSSNTDILKGASVSNEVLTLGACTLNTTEMTPYTFENVTVPIAASSTTVATGTTSTSGEGASVVTGVTIGSSASAITGLGTPTTENVLTGVTVTAQPTISVSNKDQQNVIKTVSIQR